MVEMETDQVTGITTFSDGSPPRQERRCIACGHWSCPCCESWCDSGDGCACEPGECAYAVSESPSVTASDFAFPKASW